MPTTTKFEPTTLEQKRFVNQLRNVLGIYNARYYPSNKAAAHHHILALRRRIKRSPRLMAELERAKQYHRELDEAMTMAIWNDKR